MAAVSPMPISASAGEEVVMDVYEEFMVFEQHRRTAALDATAGAHRTPRQRGDAAADQQVWGSARAGARLARA
jgi:hypothetical protein